MGRSVEYFINVFEPIYPAEGSASSYAPYAVTKRCVCGGGRDLARLQYATVITAWAYEVG